jgi:Uma2 family endonuclease
MSPERSTAQRLKTIDDLWEMSHRSESDARRFELIEGVIVEMHPLGREHGLITVRLSALIYFFVQRHDLGEVTTETGYFVPGDIHNAKGPDVAFTRKSRLPDASVKGYVPQMPDLAVEIKSPENTQDDLRDNARFYLTRGACVVWLVLPGSRSVEICTLDQDGALITQLLTEEKGDTLNGGEVLPGFSLPVADVFPK